LKKESSAHLPWRASAREINLALRKGKKMSKNKPTRKLTTTQVIFYVMSALLVIAMVLSLFINI
jgi:hypothetical protein